MKWILWTGAAVLVAAVVAVPAWLVLDDDARRTGALIAPAAHGADIGRLTLVGQISGSVSTPVRSFDLEARTPIDAATGMAKGQAVYGPLALIKPVNSASPRLMNMLVTNEQITSAKLELLRDDPNTGVNGVYMTYELTGAAVADWRDGKDETIQLSHTGVTSTGPKGSPIPAPGGTIGRMTYAGTVVPILDFDTNIKSPRDPATGQATGKRQHKPAAIVHTLDAFAPTALANVTTPAPGAQVKVEILRVNPKTGKEEVYATYTYGSVKTSAVNDSGAIGTTPTQRMEFTYASIQVDIENVSASDSVVAAP
jgi:type VI secretion system Hcp family effector